MQNASSSYNMTPEEVNALRGTNVIVTNSVTAADFAGNDPEYILETMRVLIPNSIPKSYLKWSKLNDGQARKVLRAYGALTPVQRDHINRTAAAKVHGPTAASPDTTKNDLIRILELRAYADAIATWTRALGTLNRQEFDANHSHESAERDAELDDWEGLAVLFNKRNDPNFQPQNRVCEYVDGVKTNVMVNLPALITKETFKVLADLDPNEPERPIRSGVWLKKHFSQLRTLCSTAFIGFTKSGSHKGDIMSALGIEEWVIGFRATYGQAVAYAVLVLDLANLNSLGKVVPKGIGRESGELGTYDDEEIVGVYDRKEGSTLPIEGQEKKKALVAVGSRGHAIQEKSLKRQQQREKKRKAEEDEDDDIMDDSPSSAVVGRGKSTPQSSKSARVNFSTPHHQSSSSNRSSSSMSAGSLIDLVDGDLDNEEAEELALAKAMRATATAAQSAQAKAQSQQVDLEKSKHELELIKLALALVPKDSEAYKQLSAKVLGMVGIDAFLAGVTETADL